MEIKQKDNGEEGMFYIESDNEIVAKMTYSWLNGDRIIIEHTEVGPALKGKGAGKQLVAASVEFARAKGIKIVPRCPFAKSVLEKTIEFHDVL
jgi:predicted GNAT family acetyltransferase